MGGAVRVVAWVGPDLSAGSLHAAEVVGQFDTGHAGNVLERWDRLDHVGDEIRRAGPFAVAAGIPDGDLVDLEVLDRFDLLGDDILDLLDHQQGRGRLGVAVATVDQGFVPGGLAVEHLADTLSLGLVLGQNGVRLPLGLATQFLGPGLRGDFLL